MSKWSVCEGFPKMLGCIGEAEIGRQINAATTLSLFLFCSLIFCILVIRLEVGCSCCSCCSGALHHNLLLTARNSTLLISQCGGVLVQCPHWVFGVGLSFNCIVKLINWYISIVFILIGLLNKNICSIQMFVKKRYLVLLLSHNDGYTILNTVGFLGCISPQSASMVLLHILFLCNNTLAIILLIDISCTDIYFWICWEVFKINYCDCQCEEVESQSQLQVDKIAIESARRYDYCR